MNDNNISMLPDDYSKSNNEEVYVFPASYSQQRLWFLDQFEPGSPYYNIPSAMRIKGKFSIPVFKDVIMEIARRHESLRTNFSTIDGKPVQIISQEIMVPFSFINLRSLGEEEKQPELRRLLSEEARYSFNISNEPLIRVTVITLAPEDYVVIVVMHHIISDGWSMGVLVREISELYNAFSIGMPSSLSELEIQYADYTLWQKEFLEGEMLERQLEYWRGKLGNSQQYLDLPFDRPRPAVYTNNGSSLTGTIPQKTLEGLRELSRREKVTLFMTLLAAFQVLLHKYSAQEDINIGTPVANRPRKELEGVIGLFINTIVIRTGISDKESFHEYLQKVRTVTLEAYENQDIPFEYLVEKLRPHRDMSYQPMFQAMFILQNLPMDSQPFRGLEFSMLDVDTGTSTSEITLIASEGSEGLHVSVEYNTDLFDRSTIERMLRHYENLLEHILLNPDARIGELQLMDESEKNKILYKWNASKGELEEYEPVYRILERQAELCPDEVAAVFEGHSLTYRQLNEKSNQLAHRLLKLGVGPEDIIGICIERSLEMLISMLGVLKSGAAYLPLDASYPLERLRFMMEDSGAKVLMTQSSLKDILPEFKGSVILIDGERESISLESSLNPAVSADAENLAYVIYTSGSTGRPKGSMISHGNLFNYYRVIGAKYSGYFASGPVGVALNTTIMFDASVQQIMFMLYGNPLYIPPDEVRRDGQALTEYILENRLEIIDCVPTLLKVLLTSGLFSRDGWMPSLVLSGGEALDESTWKDLLKTEGTDFFNTYGPTETTVDAAICRIKDYTEKPVIGKPPLNVEIYILDPNLNLLPAGVPGELFIGGLSVGRGYLRRPELTAEKFIPDPYSNRKGARLYRTGDRARYNENGTIEFLGRIDSQIKLRGLRIELGEIETAILEFSNIKDAVVLAREDTPGDKRIVAYIVPQNGNGILIPELRHFLLERLPEFMIPSAFIHLQELPLTPNGKIDRRALPCPDANEMMRQVESNYAAPRSVVEGIVAQIWSDVLKIPKAGINDNFFELGGHSLLATQVTSRIKSAFKLEIPLRSIFEHPTIAGLSRIIENEELKKNGLMDKAISPAPRTNGLLPLSFAQERLWFLDQLEPGNSFYNISETYRIKGKLDKNILEESLNEIVKRHEILRTSFLSVDGKAVSIIAPELKIKISFTDLSIYPPDEQEKIIEAVSNRETQSYIPLNEAPLFRTSLLKVSEEEYVIIMIIHHIITDEWSSAIMLKEIAFIYNELSLNLKPSLPELKIQYADFALWQREFLQGENLQRQLEYWKGRLNGIPALLELPYDHPRPPVQTYRGDYISRELDGGIVKRLREFNRQNGVTLFMTMISAFEVLLHRLSGQTDIVIGTPVANRNKEELEELIGFFVNTLAFRSSLRHGMTFRELLLDTMQASLEAYTYQDLPFEMLVEALEPERTLSHSPIFQVAFVHQAAPVGEYEFTSELKFFPNEVHSMTSKFDITLYISEKSEDSIEMVYEYNSDLFEKETIERMFWLYSKILERVIADSSIDISAMPLLSRDEEKRIIEKLAGAHPGVIPGTYAYILDENLNLVGENIPGELYIGGTELSMEYKGEADLTALKFIPDPFSQTPGMRIYKTGDRVKLLRDGSIEFLGRLDEQVRLHGYRVEPREIEAILKQHPEIKEVLVLKHKTEEKLVAYCIPENENQPDIKEIREYLERKVPGYLVPSIFMFIEKLPLTADGEIDREKLPEPESEVTEPAAGFAQPASEAEMLMRTIWQSVLNIENISITDNFFELGGDSIISIQLVARANQAGFHLSPKDIFQNPTIKSLAALAKNSRIINAAQGIVTGDIPLSPVQKWFFNQQLDNIHHFNQSVLFEVAALDKKLIEKVLKEVLSHHDALRIHFRVNNGMWEQFNRDIDINLPLVSVNLAQCPDEEMHKRIEALSSEFQASLNISNEPLKVAYFNAGMGRNNYLLIVVHHLLIDAVSWRILLEDFQTAYKQAEQERKITLPLKTSSFMDWAKKLNEFAQSPEVLAEYASWQKLRNADAEIIPPDYPEGANLESAARTVSNTLGAEDTTALLKEAPAKLNAELMHTLLAALVRVFERKTGKSGLLVELESHGRVDMFPDLDVSRTIGWFTSIYPVYLNAEKTAGLRESVEKIKEQLRLIPNNGIGFGMLKYLSKDESLRSGMELLPEPQIAFNYLGRFDSQSDSAAVPVPVSRGPERDPNNSRPFLIEVTAAVQNDRLCLEWSYSGEIYLENTILELAGSFLEEIKSIVDMLKSQQIDLSSKEFSDFGWDRQEIDNILSALNREKE